MKKLTSLLLIFAILLATVPMVLADEAATTNEQVEEELEYSVDLLNERVYYKNKIDAYPLDISAQCNMGFADDVAGDGVGGWSDQGSKNDLASFTLKGNNTLYNVPFYFIDPETNDGKACIMLRGQKDEHFPLEAVIPVNDTAQGIYLLEGCAWGQTGRKVGKFGFEYEDGTRSMYEIECGTHVHDYWGTLSTGYMRTAWKGSNKSSSVISLNIFALNNPHPDKAIKNVILRAYGDYTYIGIVGVTLVKSGLSFPLDAVTAATTLQASSASMWATSTVQSETEFEGSIMDSSEYLEAPAGKHGGIKAVGEDLVFEDGEKAKLWGTNITGDACYPDKETANELASKIARCGYNLVRFSDMDKGELTDDKLDRLAYFQSLLKEKGVYTYFSLLGASEGDGKDISTGWKIEGLFVDELIEKQQDFAKKLLNFKNPYTGSTFAKDKSLVMIDLANRNTMFDYKLGENDYATMTEEYKSILKEKFNDYLIGKYKTTNVLRKNWKVIYEDEKLEDKSVNINGNWEYGLESDQPRKKDVYDFFGYIQQVHFDKVSSAIKSTGYKGLITGNTNTWNKFTPYNSYSQSKYVDFVANNALNATGYGATLLKDGMWYVNYSSIVIGDTDDGEDFLELAENRVAGKPFVVSEWGTGLLSPTMSEKPVMMATLAAQQNWTPIQYCFVYDKVNKDKYADLYSTYQDPVNQSLAQLTASLYYNTDALDKKNSYNFSTDYIYRNKNTMNGITTFNTYKNQNETPSFNSYFGVRSNATFTSKPTAKKSVADASTITVNKYMNVDYYGNLFFAKNDKTIAFLGDVSKPKKYGRLYIDVYGAYGFVGLISKDGKNIDNSERMLLVIGSRTLNKGTDSSEFLVQSIGDAPIIYEPLAADVTLANAKGYSVYALNDAGQRGKKLYVTENADGSITFTTNSEAHSLNYEIVKGE